MIKEKDIKNYAQFVRVLEKEYASYLTTPREEWSRFALRYVDGLAAEELRRLVDLNIRRSNGTFFTDSKMAESVLNFLKPSLTEKSVIYDPACGAGNLLIAVDNYCRYNKVKLIKDTSLLGSDLHQEFIEAARFRLLINKQLFCSTDTCPNENAIKESFSFAQCDGLTSNEYYNKATHIVVNPPFNMVNDPGNITWAKGKVSNAALFIDKIIQNIPSGISIYAILPDVLRSGTRYEKWRQLIQKKAIVDKILLIGQFDKYTDIDVFAISLTKRQNEYNRVLLTSPWKNEYRLNNNRVNDLFQISVGPVVDYRDEHSGPKLPYIKSKGLKGWTVQNTFISSRKFKGKSIVGPFVLIKRTSRMGDNFRAIATVINSPNPVCIDNHLIIAKPKSGKIKDCLLLMNSLKDSRTNDWLNAQIRCRHLTVKVVSNIPIWQ